MTAKNPDSYFCKCESWALLNNNGKRKLFKIMDGLWEDNKKTQREEREDSMLFMLVKIHNNN